MKRITRRKVTWAGTIIVLALLLALASQGVTAQPQAQQKERIAAEGNGVFAPSSTLISYQGTLTDENGNPINATVTMKFALYDASSGGNLEWPGETLSVQVTNGLFNVVLGGVTTIDPEDLDGDRWLDIKVNNEQLAPRERITSVPYAVEAMTVPDGSIATAKLNINASVDMHGYQLTNLQGIKAPSSGNFTLLYMQDNDLHLKAGAASGGVYVGMYGAAIPLWVSGGGTFNGTVDMTGHAITNLGPTSTSQMVIGSNFAPGYAGIMVSGTDPKIYITGSADSGWKLNDFRIDTAQFAINQGDLWVSGGGSFGADVNMNGHSIINCGALTEANLQTAGEQAAGGSNRFEEGDVLCWGIDQLEKCVAANDRLVQAVADKGGRPIVIGAEVIKVLGPVERGDILVASSVPGYAMVNNDPVSGSVIAQALEDFDGERGIIKAMIRKF